MIPQEPKLRRNQIHASQLPPVTFNQGDLYVQSEPEAGPAKSESGTETRPATAGRRPEARTAAARSEPPRPKSQSARQGWPLVRTQLQLR